MVSQGDRAGVPLLAVPATSLDLSSVTQRVHDPEEAGSEEGLPVPLPLASFSPYPSDTG